MNDITAGDLGVFPWAADQPDFFGGDQFCVRIDHRMSTLDDIACSTLLQSVCQRPCVVGIDSPMVFDECVDGTQLFFNPELKTFDDASAACSAFDSTATLAVPTNVEKLTKMTSFLTQQTSSVDTYIGLRNIDETPGAITSSYLSVEGSLNHFTSGDSGVFPWATGDPNNLAGDQFCGNMFQTGLLDDVSCATLLPSICERNCAIKPNFIFDECINGLSMVCSSILIQS